MTDTDRLKRLAEAAKKVGGGWECTTEEGSDFIEAASPEAILALIAENRDAAREAVQYRNERDEAVAALRKISNGPWLDPVGIADDCLRRIETKQQG